MYVHTKNVYSQLAESCPVQQSSYTPSLMTEYSYP